jgi:hypothetical protein
MIRRIFLAAALFAACGLATQASASPVLGAPLTAGVNASSLKVTFKGFSAGHNNELLYVSIGDIPVFEVNGGDDPAIDEFVIIPASILSGDELIFKLNVVTTGEVFYTGDAARNADGIHHAEVEELTAGRKWFVGFEDILGGGDFDYNDMTFEVEIVPEPASILAWSLMGGTFGIAIWRRNRKNAA